jgi:UDPglucose 6-dehydrogenase
MTKYAANAFLATKITFINEIANLCEKAGGNVQEVARALGLDGRIGKKFLHAGPGYGGSCFPKDTIALVSTGKKYGARQHIIESVVEVNNARKEQMAQRIIEACGGTVKGMNIGILGIAFKPNTDDVRDSPSLTIIPILQNSGAKIIAFDPAAMDNAKTMLENVEWADNPYDVANGVNAIAIITEWNAFRALNLEKLAELMAEKRIIDLRNIYKPDDMAALGFQYISIGRPEVVPERPALRVAASTTD